MATYAELHGLRQDSELLNRVAAGVAVKSKDLIDNAVGIPQKNWGRESIKNPDQTAKDVLWFILVANKNSSLAQINGASDAQIQTNVDNAINDMVGDL